jgi:hypothetical protein
MKKRKLKILEINRPLKPEEKLTELLNVYRAKGYDIIVFPWKRDKTRTEVIFFDYILLSELEGLFEIPSSFYSEDPFHDFDLEGVETQTFYDILDIKFEIKVDKLTDVEK